MNENAAGIIYSQVEPSIQSLIRDFRDDSVGMWKKLKDTYSQDNAASRFLVLDEFLSISKGEEESLTSLCARVEDNLQKVRLEVYRGVFSLYFVHQGARLQQTYQSIIYNKSLFLAGKLIAIPYQML